MTIFRWKSAHSSRARLLCSMIAFFAISIPSHSQTYKVLHSFSGGVDGGSPFLAALVRDSKGNLYGTTTRGGAHGYGTVFRLDVRGNETVLHSFSGGFDGAAPEAGLVRDRAGNLYGTTGLGGSPCFEGRGGCGVVFEITHSGEYVILHSFLGVIGGGDGAVPYAKLLLDAHGNLYGTTVGGGINTPQCQEGAGTIFELTPNQEGNWTEILLYSFPCTAADGMFPYGPLVEGPSGTLFGTSAGGGTCSGAGLDDCGTVFKIAPGPDEWTHTVVHGFAGGSDGASVRGGLIRDADGNLYGTTQLGGAFGFGTIFRIDASGNKTILYSFAGADGANPVSGLIRDKYGSLWGTTSRGGNSQMGTVFKLDGTGHLTVLHNFGGGNDGAYPYGPLQRSGATLFGTTTAGGVFNQGTVFRLTP